VVEMCIVAVVLSVPVSLDSNRRSPDSIVSSSGFQDVFRLLARQMFWKILSER